jgi:hypothetical protein
MFSNCDGQQQSPVHIETDNLVYTPTLSNINKAYIDGSDFEGKYELLQFHFHWGENIYQGIFSDESI